MNKIIVVNKTAGMTSHDVVNKIRRIFNTKRVGHTGTLDPDATGVLVVCINEATKLVQFRSLDKLNEIKIPKVKLLNGDMVEYEEYKKMNDENKQLNDLFGDSVVEISSGDLPF